MKSHSNKLFHYDGEPSGPMLEELEAQKVVAFRRSESGSVIIEECCDGCFAVELSVSEFAELLEELKGMFTPLSLTGE